MQCKLCYMYFPTFLKKFLLHFFNSSISEWHISKFPGFLKHFSRFIYFLVFFLVALLFQHLLHGPKRIKQYHLKRQCDGEMQNFWIFDGGTLFFFLKKTCLFQILSPFKLLWRNFVYASSCFEFYGCILRIFKLDFNLFLSQHLVDNLLLYYLL